LVALRLRDGDFADAFLAGLFFAAVFLAGAAYFAAVFFARAFFAGAFFAAVFFAGAFFAIVFFAGAFFAALFFAAVFFAGTLPPSRRASDKPIAIACLRLFTVLPDPPLLSSPVLRSCIAFSTFSEAFFP
jgi:hypothetical protein